MEISTSIAAAKVGARRTVLPGEREWHFTHSDGTQFMRANPEPGESYYAWAKDCAEEAERNRMLLSGMSAALTSEPARAKKSTGELLGEIRDIKAELVKQHDERRAAIPLGGRCSGKSWLAGQWVERQSRHFETMWVDEADQIPLPAWLRLDPSVRLMDFYAPTRGESVWAGRDRYLAWFTEGVRQSDQPGIAAMAAKTVQPTPEPVLSIAGEQVSEREIAQALQAFRSKNAPVVKEAPRGLLTVAAMDHRLGRWNEA